MAKASAETVLKRRFGDPDELSTALNKRRRVELSPIGVGSFESDLLLVDLGVAEVLFFKTNAALRIRGPKAPGFLDFAFIIQPSAKDLVAHYRAVASDTLFGFDSTRENNLVLPANLTLAVCQVKRDFFEDCLQVMDRSDINDRFLATNYLHCPETCHILQAYLRDLHGLVQQQAPLLELPQLHKLILEDFVPLLIESIPTDLRRNMVPDRPTSRVQLAQQAEDYMLNHLHQPITLKDLCQILKTSSRPLNYGFKDVFGVSPMAYLKGLRLHAVRKALLTADPVNTRVEDVATQFGFWSGGHFARDYKALFGERPSETLKG